MGYWMSLRKQARKLISVFPEEVLAAHKLLLHQLGKSYPLSIQAYFFVNPSTKCGLYRF